MEKTESSVFLRWEPDQFRRLLLRDAETNRAKESFEADSITLKVKMFTYNNFDEHNETFLAILKQMDWNYVATIRPGNHEPKTLKLNWAGEVPLKNSQPRFLYDIYKLLLYRLSLMS